MKVFVITDDYQEIIGVIQARTAKAALRKFQKEVEIDDDLMQGITAEQFTVLK